MTVFSEIGIRLDLRPGARRSHRPTHRSARGTESTPSHFDEGCSMHGESRIATSACPTMDSCDTSVLTPCRKSSIAVLSPRLCGNIKSRQWLRRRLAVPGRVAPGDCSPGAPADPYLHFRAYGSSYHEHATGRLPE